MRGALQTYEQYKDSGIEWIGKIPQHWEVPRIYDVAIPRKIKNIGMPEKNLLSLSYGKIIRKDIDSHFGLLPESFETYQIIEKGDIILRLTDLQNDQRSLRVGLVKEKGIITSAYLCLQFLKTVSPTFAYYLLYSFDISKVFYWFGGGLRQSMKFDDVKVIPFVLPSLTEQKEIAHYLDTKTAQIDRKIDLLTQKAQRYEELKRALINETVTRGLDKSVPMKDSGIEWIGEIPEHWQEKRIKDLSFLQSGINITSEQIEDEGEYPVYGGNGIRGYFSEYTNDGNYILIGRQGALCGNINYAQGKFWATEHAVVVYQNKEIDVRWYGAMLQVMNLNQYSISAAQPGLAVDRVKRLLLPVPPFEEQKAIADYLDRKAKHIDQIIQTIQAKIEKQKKFRKTLINDVVTGKIKVIDN